MHVHSGDRDLLLAYGLQMMKERNYSEALTYLVELLDIDPQNFNIYMHTYNCWIHLGVMEKALDCLEMARSIRPRDPRPYYYMACIQKNTLQDYKAARINFQRALELLESDEQIQYNRELRGLIKNEINKL